MNTSTILRWLPVAALALGGCHLYLDPGPLTSQARSVESFTRIEVSDALSADVTVGPARSVVVHAGTRLIGGVRTQVKDGVLKIFADDLAGSFDDVRVDVTVPTIDALSAEGASHIEARGVDTDVLMLASTGSSHLKVEGRAAAVAVALSGAAELDARALRADDMTLSASGASNAEVCASESLDLHLEGASHADYACAPKVVTTDFSGASSADAE